MSVKTKEVPLDGFDFAIGGDNPLCLIAGPCVLEDADTAMAVAKDVKQVCGDLGVNYIFKSSYDKMNRGNARSYRGPSMEDGLSIHRKIREELGVPVLTDVHSAEECRKVGEIVDVVQIPAYLCMQTDLSQAAAETGKVVNIKKGQFLDPFAMKGILSKMADFGNEKVLVTERGTTFGYNNLVSDMKCLPILRSMGYPVVFDPTHVIRRPGIPSSKPEGGEPEYVPHLTRAAVAAGIDALFIETHPEPRTAGCDSCSMYRTGYLTELLEQVTALDKMVKGWDLSIRARDEHGFV
jgi:2-dehydro-3-deoxyphosphooctonate aldolase (KDO 8-P synthase)